MAKLIAALWLLAVAAFFLYKSVELNGLYSVAVVFGISALIVSLLVAGYIVASDD